uniref:IkB-like protein n=2 Tax=African swine fever virus TaxID=10497 RepID=IKBL_ASFP4|nr:RecName: Full=IkB-like protein; AltName: Full=Ankyrin repeat domain-containing protein A238L; AltName: Full=p28 [African swine fever virus tick/South Africa/Pretoriuskop Pr4/1996]AAB71355.1 Cr1-5ELp28 [African swine fever virus]
MEHMFPENQIENLFVGWIKKHIRNGDLTLFEEFFKTDPWIVNRCDKNGSSVFMWICIYGRIDFLKFLFKQESYPGEIINHHRRDNDGNSALHYLAEKKNHLILEEVLGYFGKNGTRICLPNFNGMTPVMKAAMRGRTLNMLSLIKFGADPTQKDYHRGFTAWDWAVFTGNMELVKSLNHDYQKPLYMHFPLYKLDVFHRWFKKKPKIIITGCKNNVYEKLPEQNPNFLCVKKLNKYGK